jgi:hypothetical protein
MSNMLGFTPPLLREIAEAVANAARDFEGALAA